MLHERTKKHILSLSDADLVEYVLTGQRMYEPEAILFAQEELDRRALPEEQISAMRPIIIEKLARYDVHKSVDADQTASKEAILCEACGFEVPNRYVIYRQNVGALIVHFRRVYKGHLCKSCNRKAFWKSTITTFFLGWWGETSVFIAPAYLVANVYHFVETIFLPRATHNSGRPLVDEAIVAKIAPHLYDISQQLTAGGDITEISRTIAPQAGVSAGQVFCVVRTLIAREKESAMTSARSSPAPNVEKG